MQRTRRRSATGPLWLFALALLLRAAMPFVADASAEWQGRAIGEVCSVYGVVVVDTHRRDAPTAEHAGDHCMLGALAALGTADAPPRLGLLLSSQRELPDVALSPPRSDAVARWFARRKQGPPGLA